MMRAFLTALAFDLKGLWHRPITTLVPAAFLVAATALFPLGVGVGVSPEHANALLWILTLLATLLSFHRLCQPDFEDGTLISWCKSPWPLVVFVLARAVSHALGVMLPLLCALPLAAVLLPFPLEHIPTLLAALLLATPSLCLITYLGAALTVTTTNSALVLLITIPLVMPTLVMGSLMVSTVLHGATALPYVLMLTGMLLVAVILLPMFIALALQASAQ